MRLNIPDLAPIMIEVKQLMQKGLIGIVGLLVIVCMLGAFLVLRYLPSAYHFMGGALIAVAVMSLLSTIFYALRSSGMVATLEDMNSVVEELKKGFRETSQGPRAQTFVGANLIAGNDDYFADLTQVDHNGPICIERYFFLSSAFDVNFALHSVELAERFHTSSKYTVKNYFWQDTESTVLADVFTNVTLFPDRVILTMSSRDDQKYGTPKIIKDSDDKDICGLVFTGRQVSQFVANRYLYRLTNLEKNDSDLATVKSHIYEKNPVLYLSAISHAIAKELSALARFNSQQVMQRKTNAIASVAGSLKDRLHRTHKADIGHRIAYIGLVGSFARTLRSVQEGRIPETDTFTDIDLLMFIRDLTAEDLKEIERTLNQVFSRHAIPNELNLIYSLDICPECDPSVSNARKCAGFHLIINDHSNHGNTAKSLPSSALASYHRIRENIHIHGDLDLKDCYGEINSITERMLLDQDLGIRDMMKQLTRKSLTVRRWDTNQSEFRMKETDRPLNQTELDGLALYARKWTAVNMVSMLKMSMPVDSWRPVWDHLLQYCSIEDDETPVDVTMRGLKSLERLLGMPDRDRHLQLRELKMSLQPVLDTLRREVS